MHVLILGADNRVLSAGKMRYPPKDGVLVESIPDGNIVDYRYVDGAFVYDPLPVPESTEPTPNTLENRVADVEDRTGDLEEALNLILSGVTE